MADTAGVVTMIRAWGAAMPNGWTQLKPRTKDGENHDYIRTMQMAGNRCEANPVRIGERCANKAAEVIEWFPSVLESTTMKRAAFCSDCRRKCMGRTAAEARIIRQREEVRQIAVSDDGREALKAWSVIATEGDPAKLRAYTVKAARELAQACGKALAVFDRAVAACDDAKLCKHVMQTVRAQIKRLEAA
jgi:hypothetical protein